MDDKEEKVRIDAVLDDLARRFTMPQARTLSSREIDDRERILAAQRSSLEKEPITQPGAVVPHDPLSDAQYEEHLKILEAQKKMLLNGVE